ncbi:MAG: hypothetical protein CM1200mP36_00900 [Gammaproteobacteria bacterium]|nr:MAG: hypothetical protein CM1200mP36_00900 [Gammaproteobacteria bacterium]
MLGSGANLSPAIVRASCRPRRLRFFSSNAFFRLGSLADLEANARRIVLGRILALNLGWVWGIASTCWYRSLRTVGSHLDLNSFLVSGLFEAGIQDHDASLALVHLSDASQLKGLQGRAEGLAVRMHDPLQVGQFQAAIEATQPSLEYSDWTLENSNYFRAIRIEKTMMTFLLLLIVAVAAFNFVASLMMVVTDKQKDIAILRTYGLESARVARVFMVQGSLLGLVGTLIGVVLGVALAVNVETIVPLA